MQNYDVSSIYFCPCLTNILPEFVKDRSNKSFVEISNSVTVKWSNEEKEFKYLTETFVDNSIILFTCFGHLFQDFAFDKY